MMWVQLVLREQLMFNNSQLYDCLCGAACKVLSYILKVLHSTPTNDKTHSYTLMINLLRYGSWLLVYYTMNTVKQHQ